MFLIAVTVMTQTNDKCRKHYKSNLSNFMLA